MMAFLEYCDLYKAFNRMPNKTYYFNSKKTMMIMPSQNDDNLEGLLREIDEARARDMPPPSLQPPKPRRTFLPVSDDETDVYASFRGCARQNHHYAFSSSNTNTKTKKKTKTNKGGRNTPPSAVLF